jgi:hypothetical protein
MTHKDDQAPRAGAVAQTAYLFLCLESGQYAILTDPEGADLPSEICLSRWRFVRSLSLEVQQPIPINIAPEPVIRALADRGYYLLATDGQPHGTSQ